MNDILGHPITEGCLVVTNGYWSTGFSITTKVAKVTKTKVLLDVPGYDFVKDQNSPYGWKRIDTIKRVRRDPSRVLVIDKQLKYNRKTFPENLV